LRFRLSLTLSLFALCLYVLPARAGVLYSNLGPPGSVYSDTMGWTIRGTDGGVFSESNTDGMLFTVSGSGSLPVTEIDLALVLGLTSDGAFVASIWTDVSGKPGAQLPGASWSGSTSLGGSSCCTLISITGISGVNLTGGGQYFMVVGPSSLTSATNIAWQWSTTGVTGITAGSTNGGVSWISASGETFGVFDVLSNPSPVPEPGSFLLFAAGLIGMLALKLVAVHFPFAGAFRAAVHGAV